MSEEEIERVRRATTSAGRSSSSARAPAPTRTASASTRCSTSRASTATTGWRATTPSRPTTSAARCRTACCVAKAIEVGADAILVSQTVTQQNLHIRNLTELVEIVEAEGRRKQLILACGGPRVSNELAKELGYDAGFSKGTYPHHLATFIVRELAARTPAAAPAEAMAARAS